MCLGGRRTGSVGINGSAWALEGVSESAWASEGISRHRRFVFASEDVGGRLSGRQKCWKTSASVLELISIQICFSSMDGSNYEDFFYVRFHTEDGCEALFSPFPLSRSLTRSFFLICLSVSLFLSFFLFHTFSLFLFLSDKVECTGQ